MSRADRTRAIIAAVIDMQVTDKQKLREDLGLDSLDRTELAVALEEEFGGRVSDDDVEHWITVADVVASAEAL